MEYPGGRAVLLADPQAAAGYRTLLQPALAADVAFMPGEPFFAEPEQTSGVCG